MSVEEVLERLTFNISGPIRRDMLDGKEHLVVPTVMIVEGVLNGSRGPLYYPADELESSVPAWNHKPIVVYHPKQGSACDPDILNTRKIGVILNTEWDAPKLRTESWIDILAANRVDKRVVETLEASKMMEGSTGVYTRNKKESGTFGDRKYDGIATNLRPDHWAVLPDQIGACSIADGAGMLQLNAEAIRAGKLDPIALAAIMGKTGLRPVLTENQKSHQAIFADLYSLIQARFGWNCYIDAVFDSYFVYCIEGVTYKLGYTASDREVVLSEESPVEVYRKISYVTVNGEAFQTVSNQKADAKETQDMGKKESIDALIANGGYEEADRKTLEGFEEAKLTKLAEKVKPVENKEEKKDPPTPSPFKPEPTQNAETVAVPKATLDEMTAFIANHKKQENTAKAAFVDLLVANEKVPYTKEHLMTLDTATLQGIAKMAGVGEPVANYAGAQGFAPRAAEPVANVEESEAAYLPPTMNFAEAK